MFTLATIKHDPLRPCFFKHFFRLTYFLNSTQETLRTLEIRYNWQSKLLKKVRKGAKIWNRYNQVPHLTQDTNGKVTESQLDTTSKSQEVSPFPAGDHKANINRRAQRHKRSTSIEWSQLFTSSKLCSG